ncbi:hypothetical protein BDR06DRAFT_991783 [Suillus hirtellus]|nr:hypothetical protein BDR06DRAFT_991783 [Suillus hirtellus]
MAKFYDEIPKFLIEWIKNQHMFSPDGHVNFSANGTADSLHVVNSHRVWYQDSTKSGEYRSIFNGRITILFNAFEGPPRTFEIVWDSAGTVYECGTEEYESFISPEIRKPGSRAVIVIDVYQCQTVGHPPSPPSCGYAVPLYDFVARRTELLQVANAEESTDRASDPEIRQEGLEAYSARQNLRSVNDLPGLLTTPDSKVTF